MRVGRWGAPARRAVRCVEPSAAVNVRRAAQLGKEGARCGAPASAFGHFVPSFVRSARSFVHSALRFVRSARCFIRAARSFVRSGRSLVRAARSLVRSGRFFIRAARSFVRTSRCFVLAAPCLARTGRSFIRIARCLVRSGQLSIRVGPRSISALHAQVASLSALRGFAVSRDPNPLSRHGKWPNVARPP